MKTLEQENEQLLNALGDLLQIYQSTSSNSACGCFLTKPGNYQKLLSARGLYAELTTTSNKGE